VAIRRSGRPVYQDGVFSTPGLFKTEAFQKELAGGSGNAAMASTATAGDREVIDPKYDSCTKQGAPPGLKTILTRDVHHIPAAANSACRVCSNQRNENDWPIITQPIYFCHVTPVITARHG
jgi:hypothetical protein